MREFQFCKTTIFRNHAELFISLGKVFSHISPRNRNIQLCLFRAYENSRNWSAAQGILEKILKFSPNDLDMRWMIGTFFLNRYQFENAEEHLRYCIDHWPQPNNQYGFANANAILGLCYIELGRFTEAEDGITKARAITPWDLDACVGMVRILGYTNRSTEVSKFLENYIQAYPFPYPPYAWLAHEVHFVLDRPYESLAWYKKALDRMCDPKNIEYCRQYYSSDFTLADVLDEYLEALVKNHQQKDAFDVLQFFRNEKRIDLIDFSLLMARFYILTGVFQHAEKIVADIANKGRKTPEIWATIAKMQYETKNYQQAQESARYALKLDPEVWRAVNVLWKIEIDNHHWEAAEPLLESCLKVTPFDTDIMENLAVCYEAENKLEAAKMLYKRIDAIRGKNYEWTQTIRKPAIPEHRDHS